MFFWGFLVFFESTVASSLFTQTLARFAPVFEFIFTGKFSRLFFKKPSGFFFSPVFEPLISSVFCSKSAFWRVVSLLFEQFAGVGSFVRSFLHDFLIFVKN